MNDGSSFNPNHSNLPQLFDHDHHGSANGHLPDNFWSGTGDYAHMSFFHHHDIFNYDDPLKHAHRFEFQPLHLDMKDMHFVKPHYVQPTVTIDGELRQGYYRDGDGNTSIDNPFGGYWQGNPGSK